MTVPVPATTTEPARRGIKGYGGRTFYSLGIPDFRRLWIGNVGTMLGQWIQFAAQGYLVFHLTGDAFQVGAVGFVRGVTSVVISPFAGTITDSGSVQTTSSLSPGGSVFSALRVFNAGSGHFSTARSSFVVVMRRPWRRGPASSTDIS